MSDTFGFYLDLIPSRRGVEAEFDAPNARVRLRRQSTPFAFPGRWTPWRPMNSAFRWSELRPAYIDVFLFNANLGFFVFGLGKFLFRPEVGFGMLLSLGVVALNGVIAGLKWRGIR